MAEQPPLLYSIAHTHAYQNTDMHVNMHSVKTIKHNNKYKAVQNCKTLLTD